MASRMLLLSACACLGMAVPGVRADEKTEALFKKARQVTTELKSLEADQTTTIEMDGQTEVRSGTVRLMRPNFWRLKLTSDAADVLCVSNGKTVYVERGKRKEYFQFPFAEGEDNMPFGPYVPPRAFFETDKIGAGGQAMYVGTEEVSGMSYEVVQVTSQEEPRLRKCYFGSGGLLEGLVSKFGEGNALTVSVWWKNVRLNPSLKQEDFAYTPPADFKQIDRPKQ